MERKLIRGRVGDGGLSILACRRLGAESGRQLQTLPYPRAVLPTHTLPQSPQHCQTSAAELALPRLGLTRAELRDQTIHIRIAGVDAPEMAHFGNPAQPHGKESLDWLRATITGKTMRCQLLRKDQYQRVVRCCVAVPRCGEG